jgi:hypothetical protein
MYERQAAEREEGGSADRQEPTVSGECSGQLRPYLDEGGGERGRVRLRNGAKALSGAH